jgi:hypothetical protein
MLAQYRRTAVLAPPEAEASARLPPLAAAEKHPRQKHPDVHAMRQECRACTLALR